MFNKIKFRLMIAWDILRGGVIVCYNSKREVLALLCDEGTLETNMATVGMYDKSWLYEKDGIVYVKDVEDE